jgi:hypothetical protein
MLMDYREFRVGLKARLFSYRFILADALHRLCRKIKII